MLCSLLPACLRGTNHSLKNPLEPVLIKYYKNKQNYKTLQFLRDLYHNVPQNNRVRWEDVTTAPQVALSEETSDGCCESESLANEFDCKIKRLQPARVTSKDPSKRLSNLDADKVRTRKPLKDKRQWRRTIIHSLNQTGSRSMCPAGSTRGGHTHSHLEADHFHSMCVCVCVRTWFASSGFYSTHNSPPPETSKQTDKKDKKTPEAPPSVSTSLHNLC